jgi:protein-S-isoprenylcysteine O-methyltransferase Ste14
MDPNLFFHLAFIVALFGFQGIRAYYFRKAKTLGGEVELIEGDRHPLTVLRKLIALPILLGLFAYVFFPGYLNFAGLALPLWARWLGVGLGLLSLPLIWWVQWALDLNFETHLHLRAEHTLVKHGPYQWVRHPMYTVLFINLLAVFLLSANWLIGGLFLGSFTAIVIMRIDNEEAAMLEKFGEEYRAYMRQTGRFLPKLG